MAWHVTSKKAIREAERLAAKVRDGGATQAPARTRQEPPGRAQDPAQVYLPSQAKTKPQRAVQLDDPDNRITRRGWQHRCWREDGRELHCYWTPVDGQMVNVTPPMDDYDAARKAALDAL